MSTLFVDETKKEKKKPRKSLNENKIFMYQKFPVQLSTMMAAAAVKTKSLFYLDEYL